MSSVNASLNKAMESIEDLRVLAEPSLAPLVSEIHHHFLKVHEQANNFVQNMDSFKELACAVEKTIDESIQELFLNNKDIKNIGYSKDTSEMSLERWNRLLQLFPAIKKTVELVNFNRSVGIGLRAGMLEVTGDIPENKELLKLRPTFYEATKWFLEQKTLLTYELTESTVPNHVKISLRFDHGSNDDMSWVVFSPEKKVKLGFSNIFEDYKITHEKFGNIGPHLCLEITKDMNMLRHEKLPDVIGREKSIIHFSFLFRPISIIIFGRGEVVHSPSESRLKYTGCEFHDEQDAISSSKNKIHEIDIFSLVRE